MEDTKDVGRPSLLDNEQFLLKIRNLVLDGDTEAVMQEKLDIPKGTWDYWKWKNYQGFQDKLINYRHERMLNKAEMNIEVLQDSEDERVSLQANTFVAETLGKRKYSKQVNTDITTGGKPIIQVASEIAEKYEINTITEPNS